MFMFKRAGYVTHHMAAGGTSSPLWLRVEERPHGGLYIRMTSGHKGVDFITPAEIVDSTKVIETTEDENVIIMDPFRGPLSQGAMPGNVKTLIGMLESRGMHFDMTGEPFRIKEKKVSAVFFNDLRDFIDCYGRIDHVALLVGEAVSSEQTPKFAAQMIFSTVAESSGFDREPN
jgi:hypothetical protein